MDSLRVVENFGLRVQKKLPFHLPVEWQRWLAQNCWWLMAILSGLVILSALTSLQYVLRLGGLGYVDEALLFVQRLGVHPVYSESFVVSIWVTIITSFAVAIVQLLAIKELHQLKKKGWSLLLLALVIDVVGGMIGGILGGRIVLTVLSTVIAGAIEGFLLFEIRSEFMGRRLSKKSTPQTNMPEKK